MGLKTDEALKWYCEECNDDIDISIEHDEHADVSGFVLDGFHVHCTGEMIKLPPFYITIQSMEDFSAFAEVMRKVREDVHENE